MVLQAHTMQQNSTSYQQHCNLLIHSTPSIKGTSTTRTYKYFIFWKSQGKPSYIMILTSIWNPLPCKPKHQINPLCTSMTSYFNPTTPNYLQSMNFTTIRILHHTSSTTRKSLTCNQTLMYLHYINIYQTVQTSYFHPLHSSQHTSPSMVFSSSWHQI